MGDSSDVNGSKSSQASKILEVAGAIIALVGVIIAAMTGYFDYRKDQHDVAQACVTMALTMLTATSDIEKDVAEWKDDKVSQNDIKARIDDILSQYPPEAQAYLDDDLLRDGVLSTSNTTSADTLNQLFYDYLAVTNSFKSNSDDVDCSQTGSSVQFLSPPKQSANNKGAN